MSFSTDKYASVGEQTTYQNAVLADEAEKNTISSPKVMTIIPSSPIHIATPPPVMIPSTNTVHSMPTNAFVTMLESLANTAT